MSWALVLALVVLAALTATVTGLRRSSNGVHPAAIGFGPATGFAGYRFESTVNQISAQWRIPSVLQSSATGFSSTWIGVQTQIPEGPFIQLGSYTDQSVFAPPSGPRQAYPSYGIFWSDTARHFRPVSIVGLSRPGDLISFDMTRNVQGWFLRVHNLTVGWTRSVEVHYGSSDHFTQAEWLQEDPANGELTSTDVPYPSISAVAFSHLEVNHRPPRLRYADAQVLSTVNDVFLVPTHPQGDSFALGHPSGATAQLLSDFEMYAKAVASVNLAYDEDLVDPGSAPLPSGNEVMRPLLLLEGTLTRQSWPSGQQVLIRDLVQDIRIEVVMVEAWNRNQSKTWASLGAIVHNSKLVRDDNRLRASVGLPPSYK